MSAQCEITAKKAAGAELGFFERWLTLWVFLAILAGIALGQLAPEPVQILGKLEVAQVNLPVGLLIEVPVMLSVVRIVNGTKVWYEAGAKQHV